MRPSNSGVGVSPYLPSGSPRARARAAAASGLETALAVPAPELLASIRIRDFVSLTKPRVVLMIVVTTAVAFDLGSAARPDWMQLSHTLAGTALAAGGTLALNQFLERVSDALMWRTQDRPLPSGRLHGTLDTPKSATRSGSAKATSGWRFSAAAWCIRTCSRMSGSIPRAIRASPSAWASTASPC